MAKVNGSIRGCLKLNVKGKPIDINRLPKNIIDAANAGNHAAMTAAVQEHQQNLQKQSSTVNEQYKTQVREFNQEGQQASAAAGYVNRKHDEKNELNNFKIASLSRLLKNSVQRAGNFFKAIKYASSKNYINKEEAEILNDFEQEFAPTFNSTLEKIFYVFGTEPEGTKSSFPHRYLDTIQYFINQRVDEKGDLKAIPSVQVNEAGDRIGSKLDPVLKAAIGATIYEWLGTGSHTANGQTEPSLRSLLGLDKDDQIPPAAKKALINVGVKADVLALQLGRTIRQRISIEAGPDSHYFADSRLETSLGFMALATLEEMGYLQRQEIFTETMDKLRNNEAVPKDSVFYDWRADTSEKGKKDKGTWKFFVLTDAVGEPNAKIVRERLKPSVNAFDKVFNNDFAVRGYSWNKPILPFKMRIGRTKDVIKSGHKLFQNLKKYSDTAYVKSENTMEAFIALNTEARGRVYGFIADTSNLLNVRDESVEGTNRGLDRELSAVGDFLRDERTRSINGESVPFYIPSRFWSTLRMGMVSAIDPQGSKMHRNLFAPKGWKVSFNPNTDTKIDQAFQEAIAFSFGIESGKVGGADIQRQRFNDLVGSTELDDSKAEEKRVAILAALNHLREFHGSDTKEFSEEAADAIAHAVELLGEKVHSFKGLVEYSRYQKHKADGVSEPFSTDIYKEIDGVANGPVSSLIQLIPRSLTYAARQAVLAGAAMGGVSVNPNETNLDENLNNPNLSDAYQRIGVHWAKALGQLTSFWSGKNSTDEKRDVKLQQTKALRYFLGDFLDEDGVLNKAVRNLSKPRTMQTSYGAGIVSQTLRLVQNDVIHDGIYKKVEDILTALNKELKQDNPNTEIIEGDLQVLFNNLNMVLQDGQVEYKVEDFMSNGQLSPTKLKNFQLIEKPTFKNKKVDKDSDIKLIEDAVKATYGEAMKSAIETVYEPIIRARKPFNASVAVATAIYNHALETKVQARRKLNYDAAFEKAQDEASYELDKNLFNKLNPLANGLTKIQLDEILKEVEPLLPRIRTPFKDQVFPVYKTKMSKGEATLSGKEYGKDAKVAQIHKGTGRPRLTGYAEGIPYLEAPGASPVVKTIHMLDSMIANHLMDLNIDILNNHDGFSHSILDSDTIGLEANKRYREIMKDFSLGDEFAKMHEGLHKDHLNLIKNLDQDAIIDSLIKMKAIDKDYLEQYLFIEDSDFYSRRDAIAKEKENEFKKQGIDKKLNKTELDVLTIKSLLSGTTLPEILTNLKNETVIMGEGTTEMKTELMEATTEIQQYSNNGKGFIVPVDERKEVTEVFGVGIEDVLTIDEDNTAKMYTNMESMVGEHFNSSPTDVNMQAGTYPNPDKVDSQNVQQLYESILNLDAQTFTGGIKDSDSHTQYLKNILGDVVAKVMKPVELFMEQHELFYNESVGEFQEREDGNRIFIRTQHQPKPGMLGHGIRMSAAEVYAHEMIHHITYAGLNKNARLHRQAYNLYDLTRKSIEEKYPDNPWRIFLNDPVNDFNDPNMIPEQNAAKARWDYLFNPKQNPDSTHDGVMEFIAYGMTNENFRKALGTLDIDDATVTARKALTGVVGRNEETGKFSLQQTIINMFDLIMNFINQRFFHQKHSTKVDQELENLVRTLGKVEGRAKSAVYKFAVDTENKLTDLGVATDERIKKYANKQMDSRALGRVMKGFKELPEMDNVIGHKLRVAFQYYNNKEAGLIPSIVTEMKGTTKRIAPLHELLARRRRIIDYAANDAAANMRESIRTWFLDENKKPRELSEGEKVAVTKAVLKTDLSSIVHKSSPGEIVRMMENSTRVEERIDLIAAEIMKDKAAQILDQQIRKDSKGSQTLIDYLKNAADDLGYFMVTGAARPGGVPMMNALNIVLMRNTKYADLISGVSLGQIEGLVDQLATVSSLRYVQNAHKQETARMLRNDWGAMEAVMNMHNVLKEDAKKSLFQGSASKMIKGYTKQILDSRMQYEQGTLADRQRYEDMGYIMSESPIIRDPDDPVKDDIYMFESTLGTVNDYQSGAMSMAQNRAKGTDQLTLQYQIGNTTDPGIQAQANDAHMRQVVNKRIEKMFAPRTQPLRYTTGSNNVMVPKFDDKGKVSSMRYVMTEHTKDSVLKQFSEFDSVLASMASQTIIKKETPQINEELVTVLKELYDHDEYGFDKVPESFVEISATTDNERHRDIYHMLPPSTKAAIEAAWGVNRMWIPRDVVDLTFGQRKQSVIDAFGKDPKTLGLFKASLINMTEFALGFNNPFVDDTKQSGSARGRAITRVKRLEEVLTQFTKIAKTNIVVRSGLVTLGNYASNLMYLKSKGIPMEQILKLADEARNSAFQYQADKSKLDKARNRLLVIERSSTINPDKKKAEILRIEREITKYEHLLASNPSTMLIEEEGLMPAIVDDVDTGHTQSPYQYGVDAFINKSLGKLGKAEGVARTLFMTEDTEGFRMLNNAVKMTDYVGRYVLYHHYTKAKDMDHGDAISAVRDEFINFDLPTHKTLEYMNNVGLLWFSKYQLRVLKHVKNLVKEQPFTTLATFILGSFIGNNNILNSVPGVTKEVFQIFGNPGAAFLDSAPDILYYDLASEVTVEPFI